MTRIAVEPRPRTQPAAARRHNPDIKWCQWLCVGLAVACSTVLDSHGCPAWAFTFTFVGMSIGMQIAVRLNRPAAPSTAGRDTGT